MAILDPRTRTIGIRVSKDEYAALERFCTTSGARSISDLARTAILKLVSQSGRKKSPSSKSAYSAQMRVLELKLERLSEELASVKAEKVQVPRRTEADRDAP